MGEQAEDSTVVYVGVFQPNSRFRKDDRKRSESHTRKIIVLFTGSQTAIKFYHVSSENWNWECIEMRGFV